MPYFYLAFRLCSNSSDAAALSQMFVKGVRILCQFSTLPPNSAPSSTPPPESIRQRSSTQRQSSSPLSPQLQTRKSCFSFYASSSKVAVDHLEALEPIWLALGSWFHMLGEEARRTAEAEAACGEYMPLQL